MLRIAVPNKGSLSEPAAAMLREAGYRTRRDPKELVVTDVDNSVELFYLRPRDIAVYVGSGTVDCGITGRDLLLDSGSAAVEVMGLGFGASTFRYAARPGTATALSDVARWGLAVALALGLALAFGGPAGPEGGVGRAEATTLTMTSRPGLGCGDRNHAHSGAPGNPEVACTQTTTSTSTTDTVT